MFYGFKRQFTILFFVIMTSTSSLWASSVLIDNQLSAVLGIVTNFILDDEKATSGLEKTEEIKLKKTGQTKSYDESGAEVTDGSLKDDGFYQKGTTPSYTRDDATNIVTDHITNLQWQDDIDAQTVTKQWLTQTNYDICTGENGQTQDSTKCTDTTGDTAATYCTDLNLGGYTDWRIPTVDELMYIADRSKSNPAIDSTVFQSVVSDVYWSSSTMLGVEYFAWGVYFYDGHTDWDNKSSSSYYVRCVRDGEP